jgi:8-oxo-dGTP pyrophosphatase MutT (NUDIX family)
MPDQYEFDVFISYSSHDQEQVRQLERRLTDTGLKVWFDERCIQPGDNILQAIETGLSNSRVMLLCMSDNAFKSDWTGMENAVFRFRDPLNKNRRFIPVKMGNCEIPDAFRCLKYVDYQDGSDAAWSELLAGCSARYPVERHVRSLHITEDRFLQVLLCRFLLQRNSSCGQEGVNLYIYFDEDTPCIWNGEGKSYLQRMYNKERSVSCQRALDEFLLGEKGSRFEFNDAHFWFRYGSGGTLPIVTLTGDPRKAGTYYCLIYREIFPVGWNIANGGCDNRAELLNPEETIIRELREELIVADFDNNKHYVFPFDAAKPIDHPCLWVARRLWGKKVPEKKIETLDKTIIPLDWEYGPDALHIQMESDLCISRVGFFLNINAEDFGIEVDRIARMELPSSVTFFDGELEGGVLVGCPIGLFRMDKFNQALKHGDKSFRPDFFFFDAKPYDGWEIDDIIKGPFLQQVANSRSQEVHRLFSDHIKNGSQFGLCPVTERIINRYNRRNSCRPA